LFIYSGLFDQMPSDLYSLPEANFNSLTESMSTLFQILLGESWNEIMKASMDTGFYCKNVLDGFTLNSLMCNLISLSFYIFLFNICRIWISISCLLLLFCHFRFLLFLCFKIFLFLFYFCDNSQIFFFILLF